MIGLRRPFGGLCVLGMAVALVAPRAQASGSASARVGGSRAGAVSLLDRFGVEHLARLLGAESPVERRRGMERLGALGSPQALNQLAAFALERRDELGGRDWLILARSLAPHAGQEKGRLMLMTLMHRGAVEPTASKGRQSREAADPEEAALLELARGTAALALAAEGGAASLAALGQALRMEGPSAAAAAMALQAHPPVRLAPLLAIPGAPTVELARLLGALGDQRAFHSLRGWARGESAEVRAAAAVALTELGHLETVPLARQWLEHELPVLREAALRILMLAHDPAAARTLSERLSMPKVDTETQRRALMFPSPALAPVALERVSGPGARETWWWTLLGRTGGQRAAAELGAALGRSDSAFVAAHALSRWAGPAAHGALAGALRRRVALPLVVRAAAARARFRAERFEGLAARLGELVRSSAPSERAAGAWGLSLISDRAALTELESGDEVRVLAAANNALLFGDAVLVRAARLLSAAPPGRLRSALAICLLRPSGQRAVSSAVLRSLVAEAGLARPLALRVLAARDEPRGRPFLSSYIEHPDPLLRAHAARGFGESPRQSATGLLTQRFELETNEDVRHAIVAALSARRGRAVTRTLELAARLDPSARVRSAARLALGGTRLGDPPPGAELVWAELRSDGAAGAGALLSVAPGLALPVFEDPSGTLVVAGVGPQHLGIRLQ